MPSDPDLRGRGKPPVAPDHRAPMADHKKHAAEVLAYEAYKQKPPGYQDKNDEAKP